MSPNDRASDVLLRLLISISIGLAMAVTTYVCAYREIRTASPFEDKHRQAFYTIAELKQALEDFHKANGRYPNALVDLNDKLREDLRPDPSGRILDPWKHPFEYQSDGRSYTLRSLGIDGLPGGPGLAQDVDAKDVVEDQRGYAFRLRIRPTFWQYTSDLSVSKMVILACGLAGVFASVACFLTLRFPRRHAVATMGTLLGTLLASFVVTMFIAILHIPSHH
jgi:general secretion pathway protein G